MFLGLATIIIGLAIGGENGLILMAIGAAVLVGIRANGKF